MTTPERRSRVLRALRPVFDEHARLVDKRFKGGLTADESRLLAVMRGVLDALDVLAEIDS